MNFAKKPVWLNCALLPDKKGAEVLETMSQSIYQQVPSTIFLGNPHLPHLTVYQATFQSTQPLIEGINTCRNEIQALNLNITGFRIIGGRFVFADTNLPPELEDFHILMLNRCAPKRIPMAESELQRLKKDGRPNEQIENLRRDGMALCGKNYQPHFTPAHIEADVSDKALAILQKQDINRLPGIHFDRIAILDCDPNNGSAKNILKAWPLKAA